MIKLPKIGHSKLSNWDLTRIFGAVVAALICLSFSVNAASIYTTSSSDGYIQFFSEPPTDNRYAYTTSYVRVGDTGIIGGDDRLMVGVFAFDISGYVGTIQGASTFNTYFTGVPSGDRYDVLVESISCDGTIGAEDGDSEGTLVGVHIPASESAGWDSTTVTDVVQYAIDSLESFVCFRLSYNATFAQLDDGENDQMLFCSADATCSGNGPYLDLTTDGVDTSSPVVTLVDPRDNSIDTDGTIVFNYSVIDAQAIANCSLWTNRTGTWALTDFDTTITNGGYNDFTLSGIPLNSSIIWNIECFDVATPANGGFRNANRTVNVRSGGEWLLTFTERDSIPAYSSDGGAYKSYAYFHVFVDDELVDAWNITWDRHIGKTTLDLSEYMSAGGGNTVSLRLVYGSLGKLILYLYDIELTHFGKAVRYTPWNYNMSDPDFRVHNYSETRIMMAMPSGVSSGNNYVQFITQPLIDAPELVINQSDFNFNETIYKISAGETVKAHVRIHNRGAVDEDNATVKLFVDDVLNQTVSDVSVTSGSSTNVSITYTFPGGRKRLKVLVEPSDSYLEGMEDNNYAIKYIIESHPYMFFSDWKSTPAYLLQNQEPYSYWLSGSTPDGSSSIMSIATVALGKNYALSMGEVTRCNDARALAIAYHYKNNNSAYADKAISALENLGINWQFADRSLAGQPNRNQDTPYHTNYSYGWQAVTDPPYSSYANQMIACGEAYDWLSEYIKENDEAAYREIRDRLAHWMYDAYLVTKEGFNYDEADTYRLPGDMPHSKMRIQSGMGVIASALLDYDGIYQNIDDNPYEVLEFIRLDWTNESQVGGVRPTPRNFLDLDGSCVQGQYKDYSFTSVASFLVAYRDAVGVNLVEDSEFMRGFANEDVLRDTPIGLQNQLADARYSVWAPQFVVTPLFSGAERWAHNYYVNNSLIENDEGYDFVSSDSFNYERVFTYNKSEPHIGWTDADGEHGSAGAQKTYAILTSGWERNAVWLYYKAVYESFFGGHQASQDSQLSFDMWAKGAYLLTDDGNCRWSPSEGTDPCASANGPYGHNSWTMSNQGVERGIHRQSGSTLRGFDNLAYINSTVFKPWLDYSRGSMYLKNWRSIPSSLTTGEFDDPIYIQRDIVFPANEYFIVADHMNSTGAHDYYKLLTLGSTEMDTVGASGWADNHVLGTLTIDGQEMDWWNYATDDPLTDLKTSANKVLWQTWSETNDQYTVRYPVNLTVFYMPAADAYVDTSVFHYGVGGANGAESEGYHPLVKVKQTSTSSTNHSVAYLSVYYPTGVGDLQPTISEVDIPQSSGDDLRYAIKIVKGNTIDLASVSVPEEEGFITVNNTRTNARFTFSRQENSTLSYFVALDGYDFYFDGELVFRATNPEGTTPTLVSATINFDSVEVSGYVEGPASGYNLSIITYFNESGVSVRNVTLDGVTQNYSYNNLTGVININLAGSGNLSIIQASPEIDVSSSNIVFSDDTPTEGVQVTINATIANSGDQPANNLVVQFYDGNPASGGTQIGSNQVISLGAFSSQVVQQAWTPATGGTRNIYVIADPSDLFDEPNEQNNNASTSIYVSPINAPDLTSTSANITFSPQSPVSGQQNTVTANIYNLGLTAASQVKVRFYDGAPGPSTQIGSEQTISSLSVGTNETVSIAWSPQTSAGHNIYVSIDPSNLIDETNEQNNQINKTISVLGRPDLNVSSAAISFNESNPVSGGYFTLVATIGNGGEGSASSVTVEFWDGNLSTGTLIGSKIISQILGGQTQSTNLSWNTTSGIHEIFVKVDPSNSINESDENNNLASKNITVLALPDLWVEGTQITFNTSTIAVDENVTIYAVIQNSGQANATNVLVQFSEGLPASDSQIGGNLTIASLPGQGNASVNVSWVPNSSGFHNVFVVVDPSNAIVESNENNNFANRTLTVVERPDLIISSFELSGNLTECDDAQINVTVRNQGPGTANNYSLEFTTGSGQAISQIQGLTLGVGSEDTYIVSWNSSTGTCGTTSSAVTANITDSYPTESEVSNSYFTQQVSFRRMMHAEPFNLSITVQTTTSGILGTYTIFDNSLTNDLENIQLTYLEGTPPLPSQNVSLTPDNFSSIAAGSQDNFEIVIQPPNQTGNYSGSIVVEGEMDGVQVANTTLPLTIVRDNNGAIIVVYEINLDFGTLYQGQTSSSLLDVRNSDLRHKVTPDIPYFSNMTYGSFILDSTQLSHEDLSEIEVNSSNQFEVNLTVPLGQEPGSYVGTGLMHLSFNDSINTTLDYDLNTYVDIPKPDLIVQYITANQSSVVEGLLMELTARIKNTGLGVNLHENNVSFYADGVWFGRTQISALNASATTNTSIEWNSTDHIGSVVITAVVDSEDDVDESSELNNNNSLMVSVTSQKPDLIIENVTFSEEVANDQQNITIYASIRNQGTSNASNFSVNIYDGLPSLGQQIGGSIQVTGVNSNESVEVNTTWIATSGTHNIFALADADEEVDEAVEINNYDYGQIRVLFKADVTSSASQISFSDSAPTESEIIQINTTITNQGDLNATGGVAQLYDSNITPSTQIGINQSFNLTGWDNITLSFNWNATPAGSHSIILVLDADDLIDEYNESNNQLSRTITVNHRPDLIISEINVTYIEPAFQGGLSILNKTGMGVLGEDPISQILQSDTVYIECQSHSVNVNIRNQGLGIAENFTVSVYYDVDNFIGNLSGSNLGPGAQRNLNITWDEDSGTCNALARNLTANITYSSPTETESSNNLQRQAVAFEPILTIRPEATIVTVQTALDQIVASSYLVSDASLDIELVDINIEYRQTGSNPLESSRVYLYPSQILSLGVLQEERVDIYIEVVNQSGNYTGELLLTGRTEGLNTVKNTTIPIQMYVSDSNASIFIYQSEFLFSGATQGASQQQSIDTKNADQIYKLDLINISFSNLTSGPNTLPSSSFNVSTPASIGPGQTSTSYITLTVPQNQKPGVYTGLAMLTLSFNDSGDTTLTYNLDATVSIYASDLVVQYLQVNPSPVRLSYQSNVSALIKNVGLGRTETNFSASFALDGSNFANTSLSTLESGVSQETSVLWTTPSAIGIYTLSATVDPTDEITEESELNNNLSMDFSIEHGISAHDFYSGWNLISLTIDVY
ncbi:MAG: CARDB domain-containing protein [Candidatus Altiarchaeota archaeon]